MLQIVVDYRSYGDASGTAFVDVESSDELIARDRARDIVTSGLWTGPHGRRLIPPGAIVALYIRRKGD